MDKIDDLEVEMNTILCNYDEMKEDLQNKTIQSTNSEKNMNRLSPLPTR